MLLSQSVRSPRFTRRVMLKPDTGAFLPVVLEQLARENGVFISQSKPCIDVSGSGNAGRVQIRDEHGQSKSEQCMTTFLGKKMSTSSFAMYTFSAAVMVQAVTLVCFSSFADHGMYLLGSLLWRLKCAHDPSRPGILKQPGRLQKYRPVSQENAPDLCIHGLHRQCSIHLHHIFSLLPRARAGHPGCDKPWLFLRATKCIPPPPCRLLSTRLQCQLALNGQLINGRT